MKSSKSKVLHTIGNLPMISHVISALEKTGVSDVACRRPRCRSSDFGGAQWRAQCHRFRTEGTAGHRTPVLAAREAIAKGYEQIIVAYGDAPLIEPGPLAEALDKVRGGFELP